MDEDAIIRELAADGLEYLGSIRLTGALVAGDPTRLGTMPADGAYYAAACRPGTWHLFGRPDEDPDRLAEVVLCHAAALPAFWDRYDEAGPVALAPVATGRVVVLDAFAKDDPEVREAVCGLDLDAFPWVLDHGAALAAAPGQPLRVLAPPEGPLTLLSLAFGPRPPPAPTSLPG